MQSNGYSYFESEMTVDKPRSWLQPVPNYKKAVTDLSNVEIISTAVTPVVQACANRSKFSSHLPSLLIYLPLPTF